MPPNELKKQDLFDALREIEKMLDRKITLVAAGGTAMTLFDLKPSTRDIDFTAPNQDKIAFEKAASLIPHGLKIDIWSDGSVFCVTLPDDYLTRSCSIADFKWISLKALHPVDLIVTKAGRLNDRDVKDIRSCIAHFDIKKSEIRERAKQTIYVSREEDYKYNIGWVLKNCY